MEAKRRREAKVKYSVVQHERISEERMKFSKGGEQNFSPEIFRITNVIEKLPRAIYELKDLKKKPIE